MSGRVTLGVTIELLSDAIFGSGFNIPGGEGIAVCQDEKGYPYLKGTTFKGLLRESMENLIVWTGGDGNDVALIFGEEGWQGTSDDRRLQLTSFALMNPPSAPEDCYDLRVFTELEDGVVKEKSLRTAACIVKGLSFSGMLECAEDDVEIISASLSGIKWAGTMRSRGFGRIRVRSQKTETQISRKWTLTQTDVTCIRYRLRTELPLLVTDLGRSGGNSYETRGYIPGSAIRGMVINDLAHRMPDWFAANKVCLLSEQSRFLDAVPFLDNMTTIPSIKGFNENKDETVFMSVVINGDFVPGLKRAQIGSFCAIDGETVRYWSAKTGGDTRIRCNTKSDDKTLLFQTRHISADQDFEGYIMLDNPALAREIAGAFSDIVWLGADRYEGYGKCAVTLLEPTKAPCWTEAYGYAKQEDISSNLYMLLLSPLTMLDDIGNPCGIDLTRLAGQLGVSCVEIMFCSTSMSEYGAYNRMWQSREPSVRMYDRGSIFKMQCKGVPTIEAIRDIEMRGLGIRAAEGYGQVLFLRPTLFEGLKRKQRNSIQDVDGSHGAAIRRAKFTWVMKHSDKIYENNLSASQLGSIQSLCEKAIVLGGDVTELYTYLNKKLSEQGARKANRFQKIDGLIRDVLDKPLAATVGTDCDDSIIDRLKLLCLLFDYSRKDDKGVS